MGSHQVILLRSDAPPKPPAGAACNGCGVCCAAEACPPARLLFLSVKGPCPALEWERAGARYRCGLLARPGRFIRWLPRCWETAAPRLFARWIAAGKGCDSDAAVDTSP